MELMGRTQVCGNREGLGTERVGADGNGRGYVRGTLDAGTTHRCVLPTRVAESHISTGSPIPLRRIHATLLAARGG